MRKIYLSLFVLVLFISFSASAQTFDHTISTKEVSFSWKVDKQMLHVKLTGKTTGWVGIGFNPEDKMQGANFVIGMIKRGKVRITDHFGNGRRSHMSDKKMGGKSHVTNKKGSEKNGVTEIMFSIPLNSGDKYDKTINPNGNTVVYLALGSGRDSFISKHKEKYAFDVNLSTGKYSKK